MHVQNSYTHSALRPAQVQVHTCTSMQEFGLTEVYVLAPPKYTLVLRPSKGCSQVPTRALIPTERVCVHTNAPVQ